MTNEEKDKFVEKATKNLRKLIEEKTGGIREIDKRISVRLPDGRRE
jgi:hypothetical protein